MLRNLIGLMRENCRQQRIQFIQIKIQIRTFERMDHILRMAGDRIVKRAEFEWSYGKTNSRSGKGGTGRTWKTCLWTERIGRTLWRTSYLKNWEEKMYGYHKDDMKPRRSQRQTVWPETQQCQWEGCRKVLPLQTGRTQPERRTHKIKPESHTSDERTRNFWDKTSLKNHQKRPKDKIKSYTSLNQGLVPECGALLIKTTLSGHKIAHYNWTWSLSLTPFSAFLFASCSDHWNHVTYPLERQSHVFSS